MINDLVLFEPKSWSEINPYILLKLNAYIYMDGDSDMDWWIL